MSGGLVMEAVEAGYGETVVIEGVSLAVPAGGTLAMLGYWIGQFIGRYLAVWPIGRYIKTV